MEIEDKLRNAASQSMIGDKHKEEERRKENLIRTLWKSVEMSVAVAELPLLLWTEKIRQIAKSYIKRELIPIAYRYTSFKPKKPYLVYWPYL